MVVRWLEKKRTKKEKKIMMKRIRITQAVLGVFCAGALFACGNGKSQDNQDNGNNTPPVTHKILKGVSISPLSFSTADVTAFFEKAAGNGDIITWAGDWNELDPSRNGAPIFLAEMASTYDYTPLTISQFFIQDTGSLVRPLDTANKNNYLAYAAGYAEKYQPAYMAFGIEVNILFEKSPGDFDDFAAFFSEVYDAVKAVSPDTKVFTIFQLEKMQGLSGGLFGGVNDPAQAEWPLLDRFPKSDLAAFTTYPCLIYQDPADIPAGYYAEIISHTVKPVAFTEIGWYAAASPAGWESSDEEQARFVDTFFNLVKDTEPEMAIWSFLFDPNTTVPFQTMGLCRSDGTCRPGWERWVKNE